MNLILDKVEGHQVEKEVYQGRITRMGLVTASEDELPPFLPFGPANYMLLNALEAVGMPAIGDSYPDTRYQDYYLKRVMIHALSATHYGLELIYEWIGTTILTDSSILQIVQSQLHPKDFTPLYVSYDFCNGAPGCTIPPYQDVLTLSSPLPLRSFTVQKTVDFEAGPDVLAAFGCVNQAAWHGLPKGYWLLSALAGETVDNGITYTYSATWTTKQKEDWSQFGFLEIDGHAVTVPDASVKTLRAKAYDYSIDSSVNGCLKVGMYPMADFAAIFGIT